MALPTKPNKDNNKSDVEFDMEIIEWKENANNVFVKRCNLEECNKNIY